MTDFFSRIFSIPSDDSSAYSSDVYRADDGGGGGGGNNGSKHNAGSGGGRNAKMRKDKKKKKKEEEKEGGGRNNKSRPSLPPPPQCTTGGNDTITSSKASSPASSRAASDSMLGKSAWSGASSTGSDTETTGGRRSYEYPRDDDDDDDDDDDGGDHGRDSDRRALRPNGGGSGGRGRRRRDDSRVPQSRSASEQPRGSSRKVGSVAATACDKAHRLPLQAQPVQTSPTRRHRSLSMTRKGGTPAPSGRPPAAAASSPRGDPALVPIRSWSSGGEDEDEEEEGEEDERAGLRGRRHRSSSSSSAAAAAAAHERSSSSAAARRKRHRQQPTAKQQEDDRARHHSYGGTKTASAAGNVETTMMTTTTTSTRQQHEKANWLSRTFAGVGGGSKKNSTGSGGGGGGGATQSQHWSKRGTSKTRRPTPEILAVDEANEKATAATDRRGQKPRSASQRGGIIRDRDAKLNLPTPGGGGGQQRKQPIHVGDSIVIPHHEFLEESMEMSVLTMPLDFMTIATTGGGTSANEEELRDLEPSTGGVPSKYENFAINIQEVGRRTVLENAIVKDYYSNGHAGQDDVDVMATTTGVSSADGADGPEYPKIGAYASRFLEDGTSNRNIFQSYSRDQSIVHDREDGIEVSPANRLGLATVPHAKLGVSQHHHGEEEGGEIDSRAPPGAGAGKHQWPCDQSAEGYSLKLNRGGLPLSPPPPPPMPPPLPRRALPLDNVPGQSSLHQVAASCTTPAGGNSETVAAGYNDPPGSLSEPVAHPPDPPGDEFRPFDEGSSGLCSDGVMFDRRAAPKLAAQQPTGQHKLRFFSSKAVTFSLPPPKTTSRNATPSPALTDRALPFWSSSQLLPPIFEIWSSVECPNIMPGGSGCSALNWDEKKECELLGEEVPLHVSDEWIDIRDEEEEKEEAKTAALTLMTTAPAPAPAAVAGSWEVGGASRHLFNSIDDLPDDEYLEDILNCEEEDFSHKSKSSNHFDNDIDYRHRSTWNTAYKPPKLSSSSEDSVRVNEDNWNIVNRKKAIAVIAIQRCVRGMLERQRLRSLLSSVLIMQSFIRRYISRRRYQTYLKLKQSYYPRRWKRRNMAVPKSNVLT